MDNILLSQIPLSELIEQIRQTVREEMALVSPQVADIPESEKLITTQELCEYLRVTEQTVVRWKKQKRIPFIQAGSIARFKLRDVLSALENKKPA